MTEPIAVVGLAARFPGAPDADAYWRNLVAGRESITVWSDDELRAAGVDAALRDHPDFVPAGPAIPDPDLFDAELFGMTAREAELCDPQIRVFLEICHGALEDAGYDPFRMPGSVGVFATAGPGGYHEHYLRRRPDLVGPAGMLAQTLNQIDSVATLTAYKLDLRGPALTVLTACSSALVAIHLACQALRTGECDAALAGGSVVELPAARGHLWTPGNVLSADGHCRPFDAAASGTIFGNGAGAVVLKRLSDAYADGDDVRAVVLASAVNNDGADKVSFSAPSVSGQAAAVMEAMALAGVAPREVDYVEAHATGTALGDPVEVAALAEAFRDPGGEPLPAGSCLLGAVKSNIGHLGAAAGIAGFIKTVLALHRGAIPGTVHLDAPNPLLELESTPFALATGVRPWPRDPARRRVAGVTSLGIGGTNAHAVLAESPAVTPDDGDADGMERVVLWSAGTADGERELRAELGRFFAGPGAGRFADAVATLRHGRTYHRVRAAAVCASAAEASGALAGADGAAKVLTGTVRDAEPAVAFVFPGQGAHHARMALGLYGTLRAFTIAADEAIDAFEQAGVPLYRYWLDGSGPVDPALVQPLLFTVEYALAAMWRDAGLIPVALLGHSLGELTAAAVAGVFTLSEAARLVAARAGAMARHPVAGGMLAVAATEDEVRAELTGPVALAAVNGAKQVVLSGPERDLAEVAARLAARRLAARPVPVDAAFHHPGWSDAAALWSEAFAGVDPAAPQVPCYSAGLGAPAGAELLSRPDFWTGQLTAPVRFQAGLAALIAGHRPAAVLEVGPRGVLTGLAATEPALDGAVPIATLGRGRQDRADVLTAAARLWTLGCPIDWPSLGQHPPATRVAMPGYPYRRTRHWADPPPAAAVLSPPAAVADPSAAAVVADPSAAAAAAASVAASVVADPSAVVVAEPATPVDSADPVDGAVTAIGWVEAAAPAEPARRIAGGPALVLLPADRDGALTVLLAAQRAGLRPIQVRHGDGFAERSGSFTVRPGELADLEHVMDRVSRTGPLPAAFLHAATFGAAGPAGEPLGPLGDRLDDGFFGLLALSRLVLGGRRWPATPRLIVLTGRSVDVTGGEPVDPARAALHGLLRTVQAESPGLRCAALDAGPRVDVPTLASELARTGAQPLVALRGRRRWVPVERPLPLGPADGTTVRDGGVYVVTGGTGGLGLALARGLAGTGLRPRIALLGRGKTRPADLAAEPPADPTDGPPGDLTDGPPGDLTDGPAGDLASELAAVRACGAEAAVYRCDVTDEAAVAGVVDAVVARWGPVNGLFHLAGLPGDRMTAFRDPADAAAVLAPKTVGTAVLERVFATRPALDFAVYFSSRAAADGLVGGGDYAAANAYLDAASVDSPLAGGRVLSVGWPVWRDVGMAADAGVDIAALHARVATLATGAAPAAAKQWERVVGPATEWTLDEHRVGPVPLLPGTAFLDFALRAYRETIGDPGDAALELSDVVFRAPLLDHADRRLRVAFRPAGEGYDLECASRPAGDGGDWTTHVVGRVRAVADDGAAVDLPALERRFAAAGHDEPVPNGTGPFTLGPRWRNVSAVRVLDDERLLTVELPGAYHGDLAEHPLHPALLDTVTAAVRGPEHAGSVPFLYRRLLARRPLPARFRAHVRRAPDAPCGDVDLVADDGSVLVRVEGFTMVPVAGDELLDVLGGAAGAGRPEPAGERSPEPAGPADGLDAPTGVDILLRLLDARVAGPVLVRPYAAGRPVPPPDLPPGTALVVAPAAGAGTAHPPPVQASTPAPAVAPNLGGPPNPGSAPEPGATLKPSASHQPGAPQQPSAPQQPGASQQPGAPHRPGGSRAPGGGSEAGGADGSGGDHVAERLRAIWAATLGTGHVDPDVDFFDAGGNSLSAVELMAGVRDALGVELNIGLLLEVRTFAELVAAVRERHGGAGRPQ